MLDTTPEQFRELLELNFIALVRCTRAAMPELLARRGHVVNIGSLAAKSAARWVGAYPASKFAVAAYSQQLRLELGGQGLHVLLVCPGPIERSGAALPAGRAGRCAAACAAAGGGVEDPADFARAARPRHPAVVRASPAGVGGSRFGPLAVRPGELWPRLGDWVVLRKT